MKYPISSQLFGTGKTYNSSGKLWVIKREERHAFIS